ncbi:MAG: hypothetical protein VB137_02420 [Burkholderia sp.]
MVELAAAAPAASPVAIPAAPLPAVPAVDQPVGFSQLAGADGSTIRARVVGDGVHLRGSSRRGSRRASRAVLRIGPPQRRPREASVALGCHRIDGVRRRRLHVVVAPHAAVVVAVQGAARQIGD